MDSSVSPTYGDQEGTAYNGHFGCTCYHPLFVFNQFGDLERTRLRSGNVHSADDWRSVLEPVVVHYRDRTKRRSGLRPLIDNTLVPRLLTGGIVGEIIGAKAELRSDELDHLGYATAQSISLLMAKAAPTNFNTSYDTIAQM
jgi:hypothetical protein